MSGGQRQAVAVLRAVAFASRLVILDEPTAALGLRESAKVLDLVRRLPERGVAVLLISHNLEHVAQVADRAVVLRQGRTVGEAAPTAANHEALVSMIVGALPRPPPDRHEEGLMVRARCSRRRASRRWRSRHAARRTSPPARRPRAPKPVRVAVVMASLVERLLHRPEGGHRGRGGAAGRRGGRAVRRPRTGIHRRGRRTDRERDHQGRRRDRRQRLRHQAAAAGAAAGRRRRHPAGAVRRAGRRADGRPRRLHRHRQSRGRRGRRRVAGARSCRRAASSA